MKRIKAIAGKVWRYDAVHAAAYSILLTMVIEALNKRSLIGLVTIFTNPIVFFYNALIVMVFMSAALLVRRKMFVYCMVSTVWLALAVTNFVVLCSRKTPFTAMDIFLIEDAVKVIPIYLNVFQMILIAAGAAAVIGALVVLWIKGPKQEIGDSKKKFYVIGSLQVCILIIALYIVTWILTSVGIMGTYFGNLAQSYKKYGFVYCFSTSVVNRGISKSEEYSQEYIDELKQRIDENGENVINTEDTPNIIFLQLESFFDPKTVKGVKFSENPIPNFDRLKYGFTSGYLSVPCFGAGTANTEFEVQTGINLDDFGPGEYPYKTVLQSAICESTAYDLMGLGYSTHALHNNDATFYNRYKVFSHLGYETFTSIEYMNGYETTPTGWAKDNILTSEIEKILNSTDGSDYIYTISVQGHGDYPSAMPEGYVPQITVSDFFAEEERASFEYYVNQIKEMDTFIGQLTDYLSERSEKTILVMYGDHLPTFSFTDDRLISNDIYKTQYVMWSNFEMEKKKVDLEAFQLSAYVLKRLNISQGYIMKFHQQQYNTKDYLKNLKILEYDILYGEHDIYNGENPYKETDLKMGIDDITVANVYNYKDYFCIEGTNFNDFSTVLVNDKEYSCEVINDTLIRVPKAQVKNYDVVAVAQRGTDKIELSRVTYAVTLNGG
ncbi:MAG: LTA synthase family protein [Eubacteriales bacterium]|nr:LTA synthase family protein [Eubacteriales bacterium]